MKIRVLCVGKPRERELEALHERYVERITRMGVRYETGWVPETRSGGRFSDDHVRQRESAALLERYDGSGRLIALDRTGQLYTSEQLAGRFESWSTPSATFALGGPLGLDDEIRERADGCWSLSPLTFPHELARLLVAEQLYRALSILRRTPYHK